MMLILQKNRQIITDKLHKIGAKMEFEQKVQRVKEISEKLNNNELSLKMEWNYTKRESHT